MYCDSNSRKKARLYSIKILILEKKKRSENMRHRKKVDLQDLLLIDASTSDYGFIEQFHEENELRREKEGSHFRLVSNCRMF